MELQHNGQQGRDPAWVQDAEGANLGQANPDETLRQKDPVPDKLWKVPFTGYRRCNASLVEKPNDVNLSGQITEAHELFRAPF